MPLPTPPTPVMSLLWPVRRLTPRTLVNGEHVGGDGPRTRAQTLSFSLLSLYSSDNWRSRVERRRGADFAHAMKCVYDHDHEMYVWSWPGTECMYDRTEHARKPRIWVTPRRQRSESIGHRKQPRMSSAYNVLHEFRFQFQKYIDRKTPVLIDNNTHNKKWKYSLKQTKLRTNLPWNALSLLKTELIIYYG